MIGYPDMVSGPQLRMINDYNNADLMNFLKVVSTTYSAIPWYNSQCGYACSDHASWNKVHTKIILLLFHFYTFLTRDPPDWFLFLSCQREWKL